MKENQEVRSRGLEFYKNLNKLTLTGALGFAAVSAFVAPELVIPALGLAAIDVGQIYVINRINRKKEATQQGERKTIFSRVKDIFVAKKQPQLKAA